MTASILKQDPNTQKKFKRTLIYFNTDTQYNANNLPSIEQAVKTKLKQDQSFSLIFHRF